MEKDKEKLANTLARIAYICQPEREQDINDEFDFAWTKSEHSIFKNFIKDEL